MSTLMIVGVVTGAAPMPRPIPEAIVSLVSGDVAIPIRMLAAVSAHLLYGGVFGALLAGMVQQVSFWKGLALDVVLWIGVLWPCLSLDGECLGPRSRRESPSQPLSCTWSMVACSDGRSSAPRIRLLR